MSEDANEQTTLDKIVDEYSGDDSIDERTGDNEDPTMEPGRIETSIGIMPADWDVERLSKICEINLDGFSEDDWEGKTFEYISLSEASEGEILRSETVPLDEAPSRAQRKIKAGDVLVGTVRPKQVSHGFVTEEHDGKICSSGFGVLRTREELNGYYLLQEVLSHRFYRQMEAYVAGSGYPAVKIGDLKKHRIGIPPLSEQRKIASVLYKVDKAIHKTEEMIEQTQRLRKGVMQELFSNGAWDHTDFQETQYGTIPVEWEIKTVNEVASGIGSGGTPDTDEDEYYGGEIDWVKTDDLNSGLVNTTKTKITEKGLSESAAKLFPEGTVVFAMYGGALGQNGRLGMEAAMNQACCGIVTDSSKIDPYLLHQQLIHRKQQLTALSAGTHQQNISQSMIEKFEVYVPSLEEQSEMVDVLSNIEQNIDNTHNEKERLKRLKRGLMQDLLSGEIRTTDCDIDVPPEVKKHG